MEVSKTLKSALSTITGQLSKLKDELTETDRSIVVIGAQIKELRDMPIRLDDWSIYLKEFIRMKASEYRSDLAGRLISPFRGAAPVNKLPWEEFEDTEGNLSVAVLRSHRLDVPDAEVIMCFFLPDVVHDRLMAHLKERVGNSWGNETLPTVEERRKTIASLEVQRDALVEKRTALEAEIGEISTALRS